tara:strand:+ start:705 stop:968 length:264 start_codon:yes stop_codon:yes gene_type:complete
MKLADIKMTLMKIVGDSDTPNENVGTDVSASSFALVKVDQEDGEVTKGIATKLKKELEFRGNIVSSESEEYWLIYRERSQVTLVDLR